MPFRAPLAEGEALLGDTCDPWAWAWVVCAGEFCEENLELMVFIHELRRDVSLESGGVVPLTFFSELPRLSSVGRFGGTLMGGVAVIGDVGAGAGATGDGRGGDAGLLVAGVGFWICCSSWRGRAGIPPWDEVLGGASLLRPGDDGACWRW